jgi:hypothetical protein
MDDVRKALEIGRDYVAEWVKNDGGIEACDIGFRTDLETIEAALAALTPASDGRAEGLREAADIVAKLCQKCGGEGWIWGHELDDPPDVTGHDDTRYSCDADPHKQADAIRARAAELEGKTDE